MALSLKKWSMLVPTSALAVVLLAACGGTAVEGDVTRVSDVANAPEAVKLATEVASMPQASPEAGDTAAAETPAAGGDTAAAAQEVTVTSYDIYFDPKEFTIPADTDVKVSLPNAGAAPHNFSIDALNVSVDIAPGETKDTTLKAAAGDYEYYCNVPGHKEAGMVGKMTAAAGGAADAAPADAAAPAADAAPADAAAPAAAADAVTITAQDIYFDPKEVTIPADTDVKVSLPNAGAAPHNFSIDALNISVDLQPGETKDTTIKAAAGDYEYYCNVPGHKEAGMVGKLTAAAGGGAAAPADAAPADASTPAAEAPAADAAQAATAEDVTVTSYDIYFDPKEVTIPAATDVKFILPNAGAAPHNFSIDALNLSVDIAPGETKDTTINAPAGEHEYYCNVPGHKEAGMVGTLIAK